MENFQKDLYPITQLHYSQHEVSLVFYAPPQSFDYDWSFFKLAIDIGYLMTHDSSFHRLPNQLPLFEGTHKDETEPGWSLFL